MNTTVDLIKRWRPRRCQTEKDYEKSLYQFLHKELDGIQITKQFGKGRIRADLMVGEKVIVEIKNNLDTPAKYQRLIGQLNDYKDWDKSVVIILTGKTDPNLRKQLDRFVAEMNCELADLSDSVTLVKK